MADALDLKSSVSLRRPGSSPGGSTIHRGVLKQVEEDALLTREAVNPVREFESLLLCQLWENTQVA